MDTQAITVRLPVGIYEQLRRDAFEQRTSQAAIIVQALTERYEQAGSLDLAKIAAETGDSDDVMLREAAELAPRFAAIRKQTSDAFRDMEGIIRRYEQRRITEMEDRLSTGDSDGTQGQ